MRERGAEVTVHGCEPPDLEAAAAGAPDRVAVAGGDGTIGPVAELAGRLGVPLGVIPTGTANDFARANGLPEDPRAAAVLPSRARCCGSSSSATWPTGGRSSTSPAPASRPWPRAARSRSSRASARSPTASARCARRRPRAPLRCSVRADGARGLRRRRVAGDRRGHRRLRRRLRRRARRSRGRRRSTSPCCPPAHALGLARRAWGLRRHTIAEQRGVPHARGHVVEVAIPAGTEFNVDGELREGGLDRVTVEPDAYRLVAGR